MVVGTLTRTGVALSFGSMFLQASMGNLLLAMILVFLVVSVIGTGIPTTASYIISVTVGAHAMSQLGVPLIAAHLFVFYYAVLADLTPPDAVTAFAAANLSGSEPMATGVEAFRLGIAGWLVPFAFVYQPALLLNGSTLSIALSFCSHRRRRALSCRGGHRLCGGPFVLVSALASACSRMLSCVPVPDPRDPRIDRRILRVLLVPSSEPGFSSPGAGTDLIGHEAPRSPAKANKASCPHRSILLKCMGWCFHFPVLARGILKSAP